MKKLMFLFIMTVFFFSCSKNKVYEKFIPMDNNAWPMDKTLTFEVPIEDTSALYNVYIPVRHMDQYFYTDKDKKLKVLLVNVTLYTPSGEERSKDYILKLSDEKGNFIGDAGGDIWDVDVAIMEKTKFNSAGTYKFEIVSGMPITPVACVMEVGLKVEKAE